MKSDTVMFGEPIPAKVLDLCFKETDRSDCMIVAGTSATVYPAASFPEIVKSRGGRIVEANPGDTPLTDSADVALRGPTGITLPMVVARVKDLQEETTR